MEQIERQRADVSCTGTRFMSEDPQDSVEVRVHVQLSPLIHETESWRR